MTGARAATRAEVAETPVARVLGAPLAIRFGRLGDLVLVQPAITALAARYGGPVTLVTSARYAALAALFPGVGEVLAHPEGGGWPELVALARSARVGEPREVVDLHGSVRSRTLTALLARPSTRIHKQAVYRRARLRWRGLPAPRTLTSRALEAAGVGPGEEGCAAVPSLPVARLPAPTLPAALPAIALCPGAATATKRWAPERWGGLAAEWARETGGRAAVFGSRAEEALVHEVVAASRGTARPFVDASLPAAAAALSRCAVAVAGDSGLLHLAGAVGTPVVGLFGPTAPDMGYWVWEGRGVALGAPGLACSPCSLYGGARCPLGHHRCMSELGVARVLDAALSAAGLG